MSATDELRSLLDERGVEYETDDRNGLRETTWCGMAAFQLSPTAKMTMIVTPEQAIAATLGGGDKSRYYELFGTPERAARTLEELELDQLNWCHGTDYCEKCPYEFDRYGCYPPDGSSLLEWLREDCVHHD